MVAPYGDGYPKVKRWKTGEVHSQTVKSDRKFIHHLTRFIVSGQDTHTLHSLSHTSWGEYSSPKTCKFLDCVRENSEKTHANIGESC